MQKDIVVLGNLDNDGVSSHMDAPGTFMSATKHKDANRYSFDQRIADYIGHQTPIESVTKSHRIRDLMCGVGQISIARSF